jgi:hypothetical protein
MTESPMRPAERIEQLLIDHIRSGRRTAVTVSLLILALAGIMLAIPAYSLGPGFGWTAKAVVASILAVVAGGFLSSAIRAPDKHPALELVRTRPGEIVWIFVTKHTQGGAPVSSKLVLGLESGRMLRVSAAIGREDELVRAVVELAPTATVGFDPALVAQFRSNPRSLRRTKTTT